QETDAVGIERTLASSQVRFYVGFDPTGDSLHVGHLLPIMGMRLLQRAGHFPIVLVGGATAQIGDPSGKVSARPIMTKETVSANAEALRRQLSRFISVSDGNALFVNNIDWFENVRYIDFLREIGTRFNLNQMLAKDSVKSRLETGLTFLEFNYQILQAYDFYILNRDHNCRMQFGGQDQWGNITAGTELVRKMTPDAEVFAMTFPLLLDSSGKKFGKTAGGNNVWLDVNRTPVFEYYQFWRNCDDSEVEKLLNFFTVLPVEETGRLAKADDASGINRAKEILAYEATKLAHGPEAAAEAYLTAGAKFGFADSDNRIATSSDITALASKASAGGNIPQYEAGISELKAVDLLFASGLCKSKGDARRLIQGGGAYVNEMRITDIDYTIDAAAFASGQVLLKAGKKNLRQIVLK
ncbi:MAG: tyrosine--tRNA ligase, partial [Victivallaceae bacterium]|nr:tyrosine--tRNA ligase [Victivallaceae bacterium]